MEQVSIRGVAHNDHLTKISLVGVPDEPGIAAKIFETLCGHGTNILLIVQAEHHGGRNDISFLVDSDALAHARDDVEALAGTARRDAGRRGRRSRDGVRGGGRRAE